MSESMARAVRGIAAKGRMSSLDVPILEDAADQLDALALANSLLFTYAKALMSEHEDVRVRVFDAVREVMDKARPEAAAESTAANQVGAPTSQES